MGLGFERSSENGFETIVSFWTVRFSFCGNRAAESITEKNLIYKGEIPWANFLPAPVSAKLW